MHLPFGSSSDCLIPSPYSHQENAVHNYFGFTTLCRGFVSRPFWPWPAWRGRWEGVLRVLHSTWNPGPCYKVTPMRRAITLYKLFNGIYSSLTRAKVLFASCGKLGGWCGRESDSKDAKLQQLIAESFDSLFFLNISSLCHLWSCLVCWLPVPPEVLAMFCEIGHRVRPPTFCERIMVHGSCELIA